MISAADGVICCAYYSTRKNQDRRGDIGGLWLARSEDGGKTFETTLLSVAAIGSTSMIAADGRLYLASVCGLERDIQLFVSSDGGEDWDEYGIVDDDTNNRKRYGLRLAAAGSDRLVASWDDGRGGVYVAASLDGGETWGKNVWVAKKTTVGITPIDIAADGSAGAFALVATDIRHGGGDATYLVRGRFAPERE